MDALFDNLLVIVIVLQALWSLFSRLLKKQNGDAGELYVEAPEAARAPEMDEWLRHAGRQLDEALALASELMGRLDDLKGELAKAEGPLAPLAGVIDTPVRAELVQSIDLMERAQAAREESAEAFFRRADALRQAYEALSLARVRVDVLELIVAWRSDRHLAGHLADADAMATGLLEPLRRFSNDHGLGFPPLRPVCVPAAPGDEAVIYGLFPGQPVIFVPDDFGEDLLRWPSLAHEVGHLMWRFLPGFAYDLREFIVSDGPAWLPHVSGREVTFDVHACFGAWLPEIVADLFCAMLLGPAALRGMVHSFATEHPADATRAHAARDGHTIEEHPPAHLRVMLVAHLLESSGFPPSNWEESLREWDLRHDAPVTLRFPTLQGDEIELGLPRFLALGRALVDRFRASEYPSLAGYTFSAVHDLTMSPGMWAKACDRAKDLRGDKPFNDSPRIVLTAAIEAVGHMPGASVRIAKGVRRAVIGRDTRERRVADPAYATHTAPPVDALTINDVVDAMILRQFLHRPHAARDRVRKPAHML